ncbi:murein hydrolase activator EnvC family protein [Robertmurraya kyonggiensis]|uniref:Peptidase M23 n=1 Tax=Robertmurraya kyonggiensis TaxID=1037680 RepID=A0A4U1D7N0_9BACI|nr:M23 family metallopeptidase [Robertmurraya kyonggiensis]TKC17066.1 peptidase M23 [Robertmurraya kyonggiensis]
MKKTLLTVSVASVLGFSSLGTIDIASASTKINSLKEQKSELQEKQAEVNSQLDEKNDALKDVKNEQASVDQEIKRIDLAVEDTEVKISEKEKQVTEAEANIKKLQGEIAVLEERIAKRNELLKDRARSFQENGRITYFDVLLGAKSFSDFIDRMGAVAVFVAADQDILAEHKADKDELEAKQTEMENTLESLKKMQADLESMKKSLAAQKAEKEKVMESLEHEEEHMHAEMADLEEADKLLAAQKKAIQKAIELEQKRQAEAAAKAKQSSSNGGGGSVSAPPVSSGNFTKPAQGYLSSGFGIRERNDHKGIDIAASGTVPIVAAADGVVIRSYYSTSYGNCIFISHSINGQIYTTVYAHMRQRIASEGQVVSKGQQIGIMGNTGASYGQHLHFELHKGEWNMSKSNAINPVGIVPL